MRTKRIRVLIADDHAVLRAGLKLLINNQPDMEVVGEAEDGRQTVERAKATRPHVILLDITMPGMGGLSALRALREEVPESRVLILTMHADEDYLREALRLGAAGYVLKSAADEELLAAIRAVDRGDVYIDPGVAKALLDDLVSSQARPDLTDPWESLSEREQQVLRGVALGYTNREIAERLHLSVKTVETYRARAMEKLGLKTRAQLVQYAARRRLLEGEWP